MSRTATSQKPSTQTKAESARPKESYRETIEAIVVAMILALLVRGFEAEAFVIPTGSMAPTLMGRHKEVTCPQCGFVYAVNASDEVEAFPGAHPSTHRVYSSLCVNCRYQAKVSDEPSFKGDRILVMKFPYDLSFLPGASGPSRWDVVVFRYPEDPEISYIKRLVGLPGEELRIWFGDAYIKRPGASSFEIAHKPLRHLKAMQIPVYDDRRRPEALASDLQWRRWKPPTNGDWTENSAGHYQVADGAGWKTLRYQHLVPDPEQWDAILNDQPLPRAPRATLITDFYSYNTNMTKEGSDLLGNPRDFDGAWMQPHWVGDLSVSARVEIKKPAGSLRLELVEGGVRNQCEIDLATGQATLRHGDETLGEPVATGLKGTGAHDLLFANVDNRLTFWVDGTPVFGDGRTYDDPKDAHPIPTEADLSPAGVAARGAEVEVSDLVLKRDIYYTLFPGRSDYTNLWEDGYPRNVVELYNILSEPSKLRFLANLKWHDYPIGPDRFMMLGDNSPRSKDSRGWDNFDRDWDPNNRMAWEVPRKLITGKAFFIYWPHGKPTGPDIRLSPDFRIPFRPYVERMRWIR